MELIKKSLQKQLLTWKRNKRLSTTIHKKNRYRIKSVTVFGNVLDVLIEFTMLLNRDFLIPMRGFAIRTYTTQQPLYTRIEAVLL